MNIKALLLLSLSLLSLSPKIVANKVEKIKRLKRYRPHPFGPTDLIKSIQANIKNKEISQAIILINRLFSPHQNLEEYGLGYDEILTCLCQDALNAKCHTVHKYLLSNYSV